MVFSLIFYIGMVIYHTKVLFQMGEGYAAIPREEGELPAVGGGGSLMTQSIALKYVMASEPYRYT
jgi:hypothetical protein